MCKAKRGGETVDFTEILTTIIATIGGIFTIFKMRESHLASKKTKLEMQKLRLEIRKMRRGE